CRRRRCGLVHRRRPCTRRRRQQFWPSPPRTAAHRVTHPKEDRAQNHEPKKQGQHFACAQSYLGIVRFFHARRRDRAHKRLSFVLPMEVSFRGATGGQEPATVQVTNSEDEGSRPYFAAAGPSFASNL